MSLIDAIRARQILDSRGNPTVEVEVLTEAGHVGRAAVPSGASTGEHEACELRDGDATIFGGKSVQRALQNIEEHLAPRLEGVFDVVDQGAIDQLLIETDGTANKSNLGANALLAVSMACAQAGSQDVGLELFRYLGGVHARTLPIPLMNVINGGAHADNALDFQEFMIVPHGFDRFSDALRAGVEIFHTLKKLLHEKGLSTAVGDEGGFAPSLASNEEALGLLSVAVERSGYKLHEQISFALDVAASSFFKNGVYNLASEGKKQNSGQLIELYESLCNRYPIVSIEDGLDENDWAGWAELTKRLRNKIQLVGDDIFVTNTKILGRGLKEQVANSILVKLNQIGTVTETFNTIELARTNGYTAIISHRSGETEDTFISDLAVAANCGQIKTGSASRTDRLAKYNQLLRIEEDLGSTAKFPRNFFNHRHSTR